MISDMILKPGIRPGICCDHAGYELKNLIIGYLESQGITADNFRTHTTDSCE